MVFATRSIENNKMASGQAQYRILRLTIVRTDGRWKIDNVSTVI